MHNGLCLFQIKDFESILHIITVNYVLFRKVHQPSQTFFKMLSSWVVDFPESSAPDPNIFWNLQLSICSFSKMLSSCAGLFSARAQDPEGHRGRLWWLFVGAGIRVSRPYRTFSGMFSSRPGLFWKSSAAEPEIFQNLYQQLRTFLQKIASLIKLFS